MLRKNAKPSGDQRTARFGKRGAGKKGGAHRKRRKKVNGRGATRYRKTTRDLKRAGKGGKERKRLRSAPAPVRCLIRTRGRKAETNLTIRAPQRGRDPGEKYEKES